MVEKDLFGQLSAYGKQLNIGGIIYKVIGVFSDPGGDSDERYIYTPFSTMQNYMRIMIILKILELLITQI